MPGGTRRGGHAHVTGERVTLRVERGGKELELDVTLKRPRDRLVSSVPYCGMALLRRLRTWWNKDELERADEEIGLTEAERDVADEDYQGHKDDVAVRGDLLAGGAADYERDSEPPQR
jgi:hypothetical protein